MATILAAQNGNVLATSTWTGGVVPGPADVAVINGKTLTINNGQSWTVGQVRNDAFGGAASGGYIMPSGTVTVNAVNGIVATDSVLYQVSSPVYLTGVGDVSWATSAAGIAAIVVYGSGSTVDWTGNGVGGGVTQYVLTTSGAVTTNWVGTAQGGAGAAALNIESGGWCYCSHARSNGHPYDGSFAAHPGIRNASGNPVELGVFDYGAAGNAPVSVGRAYGRADSQLIVPRLVGSTNVPATIAADVESEFTAALAAVEARLLALEAAIPAVALDPATEERLDAVFEQLTAEPISGAPVVILPAAPTAESTVIMARVWSIDGEPMDGITVKFTPFANKGGGGIYSNVTVTAVSGEPLVYNGDEISGGQPGLAMAVIPRGAHLSWEVYVNHTSRTRVRGVDADTLVVDDVAQYPIFGNYRDPPIPEVPPPP